eukprot:1329243-Pyramimonas_sp.AAC.1
MLARAASAPTLNRHNRTVAVRTINVDYSVQPTTYVMVDRIVHFLTTFATRLAPYRRQALRFGTFKHFGQLLDVNQAYGWRIVFKLEEGESCT